MEAGQTKMHSNFYNKSNLLKQLHWLPIEWRIRFKLACLVHKTLNTGHPPYLNELIQYHKPSRSTRSSASHLTFCSATQPFIWCSHFPRRCAQNMELHTSSHPPISNLHTYLLAYLQEWPDIVMTSRWRCDFGEHCSYCYTVPLLTVECRSTLYFFVNQFVMILHHDKLINKEIQNHGHYLSHK